MKVLLTVLQLGLHASYLQTPNAKTQITVPISTPHRRGLIVQVNTVEKSGKSQKVGRGVPKVADKPKEWQADRTGELQLQLQQAGRSR